jgi:predicted small metal-binding protein
MKQLRCAELFPGCDAEVQAESEEEVLDIAAAHAREVHGLESLDDATVTAVKGAIRPA